MELHTSAETISFAKNLENESARFYEDLSRKYAKDKDMLLSFAKENSKYVTMIERAYYGVITDAIEGCFAFDLNPDDFTIETALPEKASYSDIVDRAIEMEKMIVNFYSVAAEQSKFLMADVPRTFTIIIKKRGNRESRLKSLLEGED